MDTMCSTKEVTDVALTNKGYYMQTVALYLFNH